MGESILSKRLLSVIVREMKSPLQSVIGLTEMIANTESEELQKDLLKSIDQSSNQLVQLLAVVTDLANDWSSNLIESSIQDLLNEFTNSIQYQLGQRHIKLNLYIHENLDHLYQIESQNLLKLLQVVSTNIFHIVRGESKLVQLDARSEQQNQLILSFCFETEEELFQNWGLEMQNKKVDDSNLLCSELDIIYQTKLLESLSANLSYKLLENNKAQVTLTTPIILGHGRTFEIQKLADGHINHEIKRFKILVTEDDPIHQKLLSAYFKNLDLKFTLAKDGQEAVDLCKKDDYQIIFMDLKLPKINGLDAAKLIYESYQDQNRPLPLIIAMTAGVYQGRQDDYQKSHIKLHLGKPFRFKELQRLLNQIVIKDQHVS